MLAHTSQFDINERVLAQGMKILALLVLKPGENPLNKRSYYVTVYQ